MKITGRKISVLVLSFMIMAFIAGCGGSSSSSGSVHRFADMPAALTELVNGGVNAVVADSPTVMEFIKENPQANLVAFGDDSFEVEYYGIAMRQEDDEIHDLVNEGLSKIKENGVYDKLYNKYFGDGEDYEVPESDNRLNMTLKVASDMAYAPLEYINDDGEPEGFDIDLVKAIATEMGFKVELNNTEWDGIIPSLLARNSDLIISAMTITEERQESVTFSDPYFEATQYICVKEGSDIKCLEDLKGKKVGVQNSTTGDIAITKYFDSIK